MYTKLVLFSTYDSIFVIITTKITEKIINAFINGKEGQRRKIFREFCQNLSVGHGFTKKIKASTTPDMTKFQFTRFGMLIVEMSA